MVSGFLLEIGEYSIRDPYTKKTNLEYGLFSGQSTSRFQRLLSNSPKAYGYGKNAGICIPKIVSISLWRPIKVKHRAILVNYRLQWTSNSIAIGIIELSQIREIMAKH